MFLVNDPSTGYYVFTEEDPRNDGFTGAVEEDVYFEAITLIWKPGETAPLPCLGRSPKNAKQYCAFPSEKECRGTGFEVLGPRYSKAITWREFQEKAGL